MKKFIKVMLIISLVFTILGFGLLAVSASLGLSWGRLQEEIFSGKYSIAPHFIDELNLGESGSFDIKDFEDIDIDLAAGQIEIKEGDVTVPRIDIKGRRVNTYVEDSTLYIENDTFFGIGNSAGKVSLVVPKGMAIGEVNVDIAAGKADIRNLTCMDYDIEVAAGQLSLELLGSKTDYNFDIESALGQIQVGNDSYSGIADEKYLEHEGAKGNVMVDCGAGQVNIAFEK